MLQFAGHQENEPGSKPVFERVLIGACCSLRKQTWLSIQATRSFNARECTPPRRLPNKNVITVTNGSIWLLPLAFQ